METKRKRFLLCFFARCAPRRPSRCTRSSPSSDGPNAARLSSSSAKDLGWPQGAACGCQSRVRQRLGGSAGGRRALLQTAPAVTGRRPQPRGRAREAGSPWRFDATGPVSVALSCAQNPAPELVISANRDGGRCAELLRAAAADVLAAAMRGYAHAPRTRFLSPPMLAALRDAPDQSRIRDSTADADTRSSARGEGAEDVHGEMKVVDAVLQEPTMGAHRTSSRLGSSARRKAPPPRLRALTAGTVPPHWRCRSQLTGPPAANACVRCEP